MAINGFGLRSMKGLTRFKGTPKLLLQIKPALNTSQCKLFSIFPYNVPSPFQLLVNSRCSYWLFRPHLFTLDSLCPRCWKCKSGAWQNDVGPSLTHSSPRRPHVTPQLTTSSAIVITLVGSLRLIVLDFRMHCHSLHLLAPHTTWFW